MKKQLVYVTRGGQVHASYDDARRHADRLYGDQLIEIASALCASEGKYTRMLGYIDTHLSAFELLLALRADLLVEGDPDE